MIRPKENLNSWQMNKIAKLFFFLIFLLLTNCSFDDKSGIWSGGKDEKRRIVRELRAKGGKVQGYKDRKDESIAMRIRKKRTPAQLKASRDESYGKWGHGKGKGRINR